VGLVGELLERAARAAPSAVEDRGTGWWLRYTDNATWWSGAVLAHGAADRLAQRVDAAEWFYAERGGVARFQVCADCPAGLDRLLAERGYRWQASISLLTAVAGAPTAVHVAPGITVRVDASLGQDWLAVLAATSEPDTDVHHETRLLRRVNRPHAYVTVLADDAPVGIGRAVADGGWTGVFNMATTPQARRRGVARVVLAAIASWAAAHDAPRLYLQVEQSNDPALRLYHAAGFTQLATYHYRVRATHSDR
jgi:ribosomal protein S18 acetylase RimI-like enzyme